MLRICYYVVEINLLTYLLTEQSDMLKFINNTTNRKILSVHTNKKWFDSECKVKRKEYHNCKSKHRKSRNNVDLKNLRHASRNYKKTVKLAIHKYEQMFNKKLRNLRTSNPKVFWKLLCSGDKKETTSKISLEALSDY